MQREPLALSRDCSLGSYVTLPPSTRQPSHLKTAKMSEARRATVVCRQDSFYDCHDGLEPNLWALANLPIRRGRQHSGHISGLQDSASAALE